MKASEFKWGKLSKKQMMLLSWWRENSPYADFNGIIADGAIRSGKTVSMGFSFVLWAMTCYDKQNFAICGKTVGSVRRNVLVTLKRQLRARGFSIKERYSENLLIVSKGSVSNMFYMFGGKDESSQDLIQGITLAGAFFDEVALMPESFVNQATARCSVKGSKYWFNCNPAGPMHWFRKNWIGRCKDRGLVYLHFTMEDNLTLSADIVKRYMGMYTGVFYQRYILGLWVAAEGLIYDMFDRKVHVLDKEPETEGAYYVSSDYGIQNATTFLLWRKVKDKNSWVCVREYYYSGREESRQKTVAELVEGLKGMLSGIKPERIIVDPSAAALIVELRKNGYKIRKADNDVNDGIADVASMLVSNRLYIMKCCRHTIEEFGQYLWDEKAADRGEDKPIKLFDHCMDAVRYFVRTMKLVKKDELPKEPPARTANIFL
ncbi:MAG: PBSX family phage terminase large subunit [Fibrobacter sp.]|nr:PBSX family phage terminase large subunit [Fibrobacter sp.]